MIPVDVTVNSNHSGVERLVGFSIREDSGAAAHFRLRKGSVSGQVIMDLNVAASGNATIFFPKSVASEGGVYVQEVTGSVAGVLFSES